MEPWMEDELMKDIPKEKLEFLSKLFQGGRGKTQKELVKALLPILKEAKEKGLTFSPSEVSAAIAAIRKHSSEEENARIDQLLRRVETK